MILKQLSFFLPSAAGVWLQMFLRDTDVVWCACETEAELHEAKLSIRAFNPDVDIVIFPQWDVLPYAAASPSISIQMQRQSVLAGLRQPHGKKVVLSTLAAAMQKVSPTQQSELTIRIATQATLTLQTLVDTLSALGFHRVETVYQSGEFSVRGGVMDIFPAGHANPFRIDLFGDEVESIHPFDPATQRRFHDSPVPELIISSHQEILLTDQAVQTFKANFDRYYAVERKGNYYQSILDRAPLPGWEQLYPLFFLKVVPLFQLFPAIPFLTPGQGVADRFIKDLQDAYAYRKTIWEAAPVKEQQLPPIEPHRLYCADYMADVLLQPNVYPYTSFKHTGGEDIGIRPLDALVSDSASDKLRDAIQLATQSKAKLILALDDSADIRYVKGTYDGTLKGYHTWNEISQCQDTIVLWQAKILNGFKTKGYHLISATELFGARQQNYKRRKAIVNPEDIISQATALSVGDLVVHRQHGIGRYLGLETIEVFSVTHDCLALEYSGSDKLYLPVENIDLLSRYGSDQAAVPLDKLGGSSWQNRQLKVKKQLRSIAQYLMNIAAKRALKQAPVITAHDAAFEDFCRRFSFVETEDQEKAITDIINDLGKGTPMDRLVCGDVGFGKTEVALRAAFLAVQAGYQVGIIAPTTILVRQHYHTFKKRFDGFGHRIEQISRLVKPSEVNRIKAATEQGDVSILIGTHALLNSDLEFHNLGLLIVDEEQMFGVKQKEKIKELCDGLHVLTLTATPIPRTLQLSLLGIKDMSLIATPPVDRRAIQTTLCDEDPIIIHQAIQHEIDRGGQVFYVCPRISDLAFIQRSLTKAFPKIRVIMAHGKLKPDEIEERLTDFVEGRAEVLLSTQIIESGIDIPNANTMIIHNAHLFGLSQLYQLRGRIGRSARQAHAYLTFPPNGVLNPSAVKRLQVMSTLDALGAGFTLASHDMDIRGAGNLLGEEQSGHIRDVGVELYQEMLKQAVNTLKKSGVLENDEDELWSPVLSLGLSVGLPETYIQDIETRMEIYRRLGALTHNDQVNDMRAELLDRFGRLPPEAENLVETIKIKILCRAANIQKVETGSNGVLFTFRHNECSYVDQLLDLVCKNKQYKLRPDSKLYYQWAIDDIQNRVRTVKAICKTLGALTEQQQMRLTS